jgi:hypothetical protein
MLAISLSSQSINCRLSFFFLRLSTSRSCSEQFNLCAFVRLRNRRRHRFQPQLLAASWATITNNRVNANRHSASAITRCALWQGARLSNSLTNLQLIASPAHATTRFVICLLANRKFCLLVTQPRRWNKEKSSREQLVIRFIIFKAPER